MQGATKNVECEIDLDDYLPSGLTIVGLDSTTINVTLQVEKLIEDLYGQTGGCDSKRKEQQLQLYRRRYEDGSQGTGT